MKLCKSCNSWKTLDQFYAQSKSDPNTGQRYLKTFCKHCENRLTTKRRAQARGRERLRAKQLADRATLHAKRLAVLEITPGNKVPTGARSLADAIEQVLCRVECGESLEYAAWRVGLPLACVRAWVAA